MRYLLLCLIAAVASPAFGQTSPVPFSQRDVFELERPIDPRISPDGRYVVYVRTGFDVMKDRSRTALWLVGTDGTGHRPLTDGTYAVSQPRWSPDGSRLAYVASKNGRSQLFVRWMDTGDTAELTDLERGPGSLVWSPDGSQIAFSMFVPTSVEGPSATMPNRPEGAEWGPAWKVVDELQYRSDGSGYLKDGYRQLFVIGADGGTARQVTTGPFSHGSSVWTPDGSALVFSADRYDKPDHEPSNSELHRVDLMTGEIVTLTSRFGPDGQPSVDGDGRIAYVGYDDQFLGYQQSKLYVAGADGSGRQRLAASLDRSISSPEWLADGSILFSYGDLGTTRMAVAETNGSVRTLPIEIGGLSLGRPYSGGTWSVNAAGDVAYTSGSPDRPADLYVFVGGESRRIVQLNEDVLAHRSLGSVEEIWYESSFDGRRIQGWIVLPHDFDASKKYPLILEIHGGPFSAYGPHFAAEIQLYAAAGYVVLYTNPRGSSSYGAEFGNLIHHAYPGNDYDDLMSGVDAVLARGFVDPNQLFVTGGSGGGVLSSWIIGKTDRFRAAVVQKPVINWYSFVLNADAPAFFYRYWFPGPPWENTEHYMARSPISLVGNVTTPTMLITGEEDYRTPMSETEQYYGALQIRGVESAMVRVPDASHGIAARPSNLIEKVGYVVGWFDKYRSTVVEAGR